MILWLAYDCTGYVLFTGEIKPVRYENEKNAAIGVGKLWIPNSEDTKQFRTNTGSSSSNYMAEFIEILVGRKMCWEDEPICIDASITDEKFMSIEEKIKTPHDRDLFVAGMVYALQKD